MILLKYILKLTIARFIEYFSSPTIVRFREDEGVNLPIPHFQLARARCLINQSSDFLIIWMINHLIINQLARAKCLINHLIIWLSDYLIIWLSIIWLSISLQRQSNWPIIWISDYLIINHMIINNLIINHLIINHLTFWSSDYQSACESACKSKV